jgi:hypothetical protein
MISMVGRTLRLPCMNCKAVHTTVAISVASVETRTMDR